VTDRILAVLYTSVMGLTRCYKRHLFFLPRELCSSAVLGVVILSVRPSVCPSVRHTRALWLIQRTYRRYFISHKRAVILVFCCRRSQRNSNGVTLNGAPKRGGVG